jgi:hypothetical protein
MFHTYEFKTSPHNKVMKENRTPTKIQNGDYNILKHKHFCKVSRCSSTNDKLYATSEYYSSLYNSAMYALSENSKKEANVVAVEFAISVRTEIIRLIIL